MLTPLKNPIRSADNSETKVVVVDNFYDDPFSIRNFALQQTFVPHTYHPGNRTKSLVDDYLQQRIQSFLPKSAGKIVFFKSVMNNCSFQINLANEESWIHSDNTTSNWAGVVYLTPDAPLKSGTSFYKFYDGTTSSTDERYNMLDVMNNCKNYYSWELLSSVENVFNRLVLYDSRQYHCATNYFGDTIDNGRLIQLFFFVTQF
jgi:hypothetical protein